MTKRETSRATWRVRSLTSIAGSLLFTRRVESVAVTGLGAGETRCLRSVECGGDAFLSHTVGGTYRQASARAGRLYRLRGSDALCPRQIPCRWQYHGGRVRGCYCGFHRLRTSAGVSTANFAEHAAWPVRRVVSVPATGKPGWYELKWTAEAGGQQIGSTRVRVYAGGP